MLNKQTF